MENNNAHDVKHVVDLILADYKKGRDIDKMDTVHQPNQDVIIDIVEKLLRIFFPGYYRDRYYMGFNESNRLSVLIEDVLFNLQSQIATVLRSTPEFATASNCTLMKEAWRITYTFAEAIPKIREYLDTDLEATFEGDPAACDKDEIVLSYPGLYTTALNRIAHELFVLGVPLIPRMITEHAHSKTGIDIHPGATIGHYFCIDHGTGIVIGSTTTIGDHVKVYQGVTLGALSTRAGQLLHGKKRHPTIEDYVTVYSGASILGGETVIGANSVIGSNAFITKSVPADSRVSIQNHELHMKRGSKSGEATFEEPEDSSNGNDDSWVYVI
jgi:serine O-acetyltransferase